MHPEDPNRLLAGVGNNAYPTGGGVFLTTDGGVTWEQGVLAETGQRFWSIITSVEFSGLDPNLAYAASDAAVYRSEDGGDRWTIVSGGPPDFSYGPPGVRAGVPIDLQVDPRQPERLFINNYGGGNFLSDDGGKTWQVASSGYTGANLHDIAVDPFDYRHVFTIGRSGLFVSGTRGSEWRGLNYPPALAPEWYAVELDPTNPDWVIISDEHMGTLLASEDGGRQFSVVFHHPQVNPDAEGSSGRHGFKALVFAPSDTSVVYAGMCRDRNTAVPGVAGPSYGVHRSRDGGQNWQDANDSNVADQNINVLAVDPGSSQTVYAGTLEGGVLRTTNGGEVWEALNNGLENLDVSSLAIDPSQPEVIYAGTEGGACTRRLTEGRSGR